MFEGSKSARKKDLSPLERATEKVRNADGKLSDTRDMAESAREEVGALNAFIESIREKMVNASPEEKKFLEVELAKKESELSEWKSGVKQAEDRMFELGDIRDDGEEEIKSNLN